MLSDSSDLKCEIPEKIDIINKNLIFISQYYAENPEEVQYIEDLITELLKIKSDIKKRTR